MNYKLFACAAVAAVSVVAGQAAAQVSIQDAGGNYAAGVTSTGTLYNGGGGCGSCEGFTAANTGLARLSDGYDPIQPGTPRDSWGVSLAGNSAYSDPYDFGNFNLGASSIVAGANSATVSTDTLIGLSLVQRYSFVGDGNILKIDTSVTNNSGSQLDDILFQRNVDWDITPTIFAEEIFGPSGSFGSVVSNSYFGFENPDPANPFIFACGLTCDAGPGDLGAGIRLNLGSLLTGATARFAFYYGISALGQTPDQLVAEGHAAGASYIIGGRSSDGGSNSAFLGVGAAGVPEPATWAMMIMGFFGLGSVVRRRRALAA